MIIQLLIQAATLFFQFLLQLILALLAAFLYLLPWVIRAASIVFWLVSMFICIQTIQNIYGPISDQIPLFALQFGAVLMMIQWAMAGLYAGKQIWGMLVAGAATSWAVSYGMLWLSEKWSYADLFFRVLPPALLAVGMFTISVRTRARRSHARQEHRTPTTAEASA